MYLINRGVAKELRCSDRHAQDDHEAEPRPHKECRRPSSRSPPLPPDGDRRLAARVGRSEEHTSELQSLRHLVCRLLLEKKKQKDKIERERLQPNNGNEHKTDVSN